MDAFEALLSEHIDTKTDTNDATEASEAVDKGDVIEAVAVPVDEVASEAEAPGDEAPTETLVVSEAEAPASDEAPVSDEAPASEAEAEVSEAEAPVAEAPVAEAEAPVADRASKGPKGGPSRARALAHSLRGESAPRRAPVKRGARWAVARTTIPGRPVVRPGERAVTRAAAAGPRPAPSVAPKEDCPCNPGNAAVSRNAPIVYAESGSASVLRECEVTFGAVGATYLYKFDLAGRVKTQSALVVRHPDGVRVSVNGSLAVRKENALSGKHAHPGLFLDPVSGLLRLTRPSGVSFTRVEPVLTHDYPPGKPLGDPAKMPKRNVVIGASWTT